MSELVGFVIALLILLALAAIARSEHEDGLLSHLMGLVIVIAVVGSALGFVLILNQVN